MGGMVVFFIILNKMSNVYDKLDPTVTDLPFKNNLLLSTNPFTHTSVIQRRPSRKVTW